jgi:hypothetical protein
MSLNKIMVPCTDPGKVALQSVTSNLLPCTKVKTKLCSNSTCMMESWVRDSTTDEVLGLLAEGELTTCRTAVRFHNFNNNRFRS